MLRVARQRPYGDRVRWIEGGTSRLGTPDADLAIMTGHVAQFFLSDESWRAALGALHAALRPGGRLAFESRNPTAREWESWSHHARQAADDPVVGRVETWCEVHDVRAGLVSCTNHYAFASTGEEAVAPNRLRVRSGAALAASRRAAG